MQDIILPAVLVLVCHACCGDPDLKPICKRCSGTGAEPTEPRPFPAGGSSV